MEETRGEIDIKESNGREGKKRCEEGEWHRNEEEIQEKWKRKEEEEIQIRGMGKKGRGGDMRKRNVSEGKKINIMKRTGKMEGMRRGQRKGVERKGKRVRYRKWN